MKSQSNLSRRICRILAILLSFLLVFEQSGFAQILPLANPFVADAFRPLHLRYLSYDPINNNFKVLLDKGDAPNPKLQEASKTLLNYFYIGLTLPSESFWVNLRPDSEDNIIDNELSRTDVGRIMLEADLQLKKDTANSTSPNIPEGKAYWDKLYKKAQELFGEQNIAVPTVTRVWIVPDEIILSETQTSAYIYKATLKVLLEQDYIQGAGGSSQGPVYAFEDERLKTLNEYSSQLFREIIIPKLNKEVNASKRYAALRQVYYSLIMAEWFKARFSETKGTAPDLIDSRNLTGLTSKEPWSKSAYFKAYQKSVNEGEYNIPQMQYDLTATTKNYVSGGVLFSFVKMTKAMTGNGVIVSISHTNVPGFGEIPHNTDGREPKFSLVPSNNVLPAGTNNIDPQAAKVPAPAPGAEAMDEGQIVFELANNQGIDVGRRAQLLARLNEILDNKGILADIRDPEMRYIRYKELKNFSELEARLIGLLVATSAKDIREAKDTLIAAFQDRDTELSNKILEISRDHEKIKKLINSAKNNITFEEAIKRIELVRRAVNPFGSQEIRKRKAEVEKLLTSKIYLRVPDIASDWLEAVSSIGKGRELLKEGKFEEAKVEFKKAEENFIKCENNEEFLQYIGDYFGPFAHYKFSLNLSRALQNEAEARQKAKQLRQENSAEDYTDNYVTYHGTVPEKLVLIAEQGLKPFVEAGHFERGSIYVTTDPALARTHVEKNGPHDTIKDLNKTFSRTPMVLTVRLPKEWVSNQPEVIIDPERLEAFEGALETEGSPEEGNIWGIKLPVDRVPPEFIFVRTESGKTIPIKDFIAGEAIDARGKKIVFGQAGPRVTDWEATRAYNRKGGWKLHIGVDPENYKEVDEWLFRNHKGQYKLLSGGEHYDGADFTIYIGSKAAADAFAEKMEREIGHLLGEPLRATNRGSDRLFTPHISGRFDIQLTILGIERGLTIDGNNGIPQDGSTAQLATRVGQLEKGNIAISRVFDPAKLPEYRSELEAKMKQIERFLEREFGEYFTGPKAPSAAPEVKAEAMQPTTVQAPQPASSPQPAPAPGAQGPGTQAVSAEGAAQSLDALISRIIGVLRNDHLIDRYSDDVLKEISKTIITLFGQDRAGKFFEQYSKKPTDDWSSLTKIFDFIASIGIKKYEGLIRDIYKSEYNFLLDTEKIFGEQRGEVASDAKALLKSIDADIVNLLESPEREKLLRIYILAVLVVIQDKFPFLNREKYEDLVFSVLFAAHFTDDYLDNADSHFKISSYYAKYTLNIKMLLGSLAHEMMHNILDGYDYTYNDVDRAAISEFLCDISEFAFLEEMGWLQDIEGAFREHKSSAEKDVRQGYLSIEPHLVGRRGLYRIMQAIEEAGYPLAWDILLRLGIDTVRPNPEMIFEDFREGLLRKYQQEFEKIYGKNWVRNNAPLSDEQKNDKALVTHLIEVLRNKPALSQEMEKYSDEVLKDALKELISLFGQDRVIKAAETSYLLYDVIEVITDIGRSKFRKAVMLIGQEKAIGRFEKSPFSLARAIADSVSKKKDVVPEAQQPVQLPAPAASAEGAGGVVVKLSGIFGKREIKVEGTSLGEVLQNLPQEVKEQILNPDGTLKEHIIIGINNDDEKITDLNIPIKSTDKISIMPDMAGGSGEEEAGEFKADKQDNIGAAGLEGTPRDGGGMGGLAVKNDKEVIDKVNELNNMIRSGLYSAKTDEVSGIIDTVERGLIAMEKYRKQLMPENARILDEIEQEVERQRQANLFERKVKDVAERNGRHYLDMGDSLFQDGNSPHFYNPAIIGHATNYEALEQIIFDSDGYLKPQWEGYPIFFNRGSEGQFSRVRVNRKPGIVSLVFDYEALKRDGIRLEPDPAEARITVSVALKYLVKESKIHVWFTIQNILEARGKRFEGELKYQVVRALGYETENDLLSDLGLKETKSYKGDDNSSPSPPTSASGGIDDSTSSPSIQATGKKTGGIDLRNLPIVTRAIGNLSAKIDSVALGRLNSMNLDTEWLEIESLVNQGAIPQAERLKEYIQASCLKGNVDKDTDKVISCIAGILRIEEGLYAPTEPLLIDILVAVESASSLSELKAAFIGNP